MHNSFFFLSKLSDLKDRKIFQIIKEMNAFILHKQFVTHVWAHRNLFKQIPNQILILNANYASNSAFVQTKQNTLSNKLVYKNVSICHFSVWSSNCRLQMRKSTNESDIETNKILTPPTIDYRNSSSDDQVSTHVRPAEKGNS